MRGSSSVALFLENPRRGSCRRTSCGSGHASRSSSVRRGPLVLGQEPRASSPGVHPPTALDVTVRRLRECSASPETTVRHSREFVVPPCSTRVRRAAHSDQPLRKRAEPWAKRYGPPGERDAPPAHSDRPLAKCAEPVGGSAMVRRENVMRRRPRAIGRWVSVPSRRRSAMGRRENAMRRRPRSDRPPGKARHEPTAKRDEPQGERDGPPVEKRSAAGKARRAVDGARIRRGRNAMSLPGTETKDIGTHRFGRDEFRLFVESGGRIRSIRQPSCARWAAGGVIPRGAGSDIAEAET